MLRLPSFLRPRRRILIHIGLPKCGSTSIQAHMADHDAAYRARSVCYPHAFRTPDGYRNHLPLARLAPRDLEGAVDAIVAEAGDCRTIVLSCEHWTNTFPHCNLADLCETLARRMPEWDLRILAYFRNPFDFVESCYAQYVLAGLFQISRHTFYTDGRPSIEKFLTGFEAMRGFPLWSNLGFARLLHEHLPGPALSLRSMQPGDAPGDGMLTDFCALARLPAPGPAPRANTRLSNRKLAELEHVQTLVDQDTYGALRDRLIAHDFPRPPGTDDRRATTLHIDPTLAETIGQRLAQERAPLAAMFDTPTDALCAVPDRNWTRHDVLGTDDKDTLARFVARHTGPHPKSTAP